MSTGAATRSVPGPGRGTGEVTGSRGLAVLLAQVGLIGDRLTRHRIYLEEVLYRQRAGRG